MLKKLDWYIIKKFWGTFFYVVLIFSMIAVVIDFSEKVEEFIDESLGPVQVITEYYVNFILFINGLLWPLFVLISVIFFTSRMAFNSEIISMLNAGISFRRLMLPYMVGAAGIAGLHFIANHLLIPVANKTRLDFEHAYVWKESDHGKTYNVHMFIDSTTKIYVLNYHKPDSAARNFQLEKFENNELKVLFKADKAQWKGYPNKWELSNYEIRTFDGMNETFRQGKTEKLDTTFNLTPLDFVRYNDTKDAIPTPQLQDFINKERQRGIGHTKLYEIELHRRTADPFTIFIVTIIGMSLASRKVRGGLGLHLALGIGLGAIYIFLARFSITFATNDALPAMLGVWLPNIFFSIIALILVSKAQK